MGLRLRSARRERGMSQEDLARRVGISMISISRLERGVHRPKHQNLEAIARELGVSPSWILTGEGRGLDGDPCEQKAGIS